MRLSGVRPGQAANYQRTGHIGADQSASTALGSVYVAFPNFEALRLAVNTATMGRLLETLAATLAGATGLPLQDRLLGPGRRLHGFCGHPCHLVGGIV